MKDLNQSLNERRVDMSGTMDVDMWQYQFPPYVGGNDLASQIDKIASEVEEVRDAMKENYMQAVIVELMDIVHAAETALRQLELQSYTLHAAKRDVIRKNLNRGYYGNPPAKRWYAVAVSEGEDGVIPTAKAVAELLSGNGNGGFECVVSPIAEGAYRLARESKEVR